MPEIKKISISDSDVNIKTTRSGGNGGQAVNKIESCVVMTHKSTGITVRCEFGPSQYQNKILAFEILQAKLESQNSKQLQSQYNSDRRHQMGTGQRAEKIRTYMVKHNLAVDHRNNTKMSLKDWMKGKWN